MSLADLVLVIIGGGATAYALFGGADFGGGMWHLLARGPRRHEAQALVTHAMGPVWEANHVWLIFVLIGLFAAFPAAFAALSRALIAPLGLALVGIVLRGAAFVFCQYGAGQLWRHVFAISSVFAPAMLGFAGGSLASGELDADGTNLYAPFVEPIAWWAAAISVFVCALLAAVFLCADARREGNNAVADDFRRRALSMSLVVGVLAMGGFAVLVIWAPQLAESFVDRCLGLLGCSIVAGVITIGLLWRRHFWLARGSAALASASIFWGWVLAQYPQLGVGEITVGSAAAPTATLRVFAVILILGFALVVPALIVLFRTFGTNSPPATPR